MRAKIKSIMINNYQQVLIVILAFLAMVLVSYIYVSRIMQEQMLTIGEETMNTTQTSVSASLSEAELLFSSVSKETENMLLNGNSNEEILDFLKNTNQYYGTDRSLRSDFLKVYAFIHGEFLDGSGWVPPVEYDPTQRPWYIGALESGDEIYFSEPYLDADTGGMCISFSQVIDSNDNLYGVVAIDLNLTRITDYIANQEISNNGYGVLIDDTLHFTTHRDTSLIGLYMEQSGGEYGKLAQMLADGTSISAERFMDWDGTDSIAFFRTIFNGWHIGIIIPRTSYYKQLYTLGVVLCSLGVVLMLILSYMLVHIQSAKMRSEEESQSKSSFLARMSHEMRTPMNAIIGITNIAKKSNDINEISTYLDKIDNSANHLLGVINDVLDMSKIESGKMELSDSVFRFNDMLDQVLTIIRFKLDEKNQNLNVQIDEDVPAFVSADRQRLAQVITNLLSNANKFTPDGGNIELSVSKIEDHEDKCKLQIAVEDDGIGISKEQQSRLFQSFEQANNSISRRYGGTGLGLVISRNIINLMNGEIWIESEQGEGARFIFTIEIGVGADQIDEHNKEDNSDIDVTDLFAGKHILLADDIEINREIIIALLSETGVVIDCVENGQEACDVFAKNPDYYDLIFMDVHMPEMDGYEATRTIRAMKTAKAQSIPIIAMTADVFSEDVQKSLLAGMNDHVGKPINIDIVIAKMKRYL